MLFITQWAKRYVLYVEKMVKCFALCKGNAENVVLWVCPRSRPGFEDEQRWHWKWWSNKSESPRVACVSQPSHVQKAMTTCGVYQFPCMQGKLKDHRKYWLGIKMPLLLSHPPYVEIFAVHLLTGELNASRYKQLSKERRILGLYLSWHPK